jgi:hypothetical protein
MSEPHVTLGHVPFRKGEAVVNVMLGTISDVVSVVSVLISAAAFGFAVYTWRRQSEVQGRLAGIEEDRRGEELASRAKANVLPSFEQRPPSSGQRPREVLVLRNPGQALASEVMVEFPVLQEGRSSPLLDNPFPVSIGPDQPPMETPVAFVYGDPSVLPVRITWVDEAGHHDQTFDVSRGG